MKPSDILDTITSVVQAATPYLPASVAGPVKAVGVLLEAADGTAHRLVKDGVEQVQARETEAGRSISRASHLAGLREAIERLGNGADEHGRFYNPPTIDAIMAEVAKRTP